MLFRSNRQIREELNILLQKGFSRMFVAPKTSDDVSLGEMTRIEDLLELDDNALQAAVSASTGVTYILVDRIVKKRV